jgi:flagellar biosynthesis component FlhA
VARRSDNEVFSLQEINGMATAAVPRASQWFAGWQDLVLPLAVVASVLVVLVPLPPQLLDVLLAANIAIAVLVLLTTIYVRTPLEFSVFPTLLLACTLARLVLNVATTRLILSDAGSEGVQPRAPWLKASAISSPATSS